MKLLRYSIIIAAALSAAACHKSDAGRGQSEAPSIAVSAVITDSVTIYKDYPGTLTADNTVDVVCIVDGTLSRPHYTGGEHVTAGQVLFTISSQTIRDAVSQAEASLATARSQNEYAEAHYQAVSRALESNAVSKMEVSQALSARDQSRAAVKNAEAALSAARVRLNDCTITAPISGHITNNILSGGMYVTGEVSPVKLATIYDDDVLLANFAIEDASFQEMFLDPGRRLPADYSRIPLQFSDTLPHSYTADLSYLAPNIDPSTGTMHLQAKIKNPYGELKTGMYLTIHMPYRVEPHAVLVRDASLGTDQLGRYLYVVNDSDRVVYTPVKTGDLVADTMRVVTSGVKPGERYVTSALLKVRDGMTVRPVATDKK